MCLSFQSENWPDLAEQIKPLLEKHWAEIALDKQEIPLDPDFDRYAKLHADGCLAFTTARNRDGKLIGYYATIIAPHPHYKSTLFGFLDVYFMLPEYRDWRSGLLLFSSMEADMQRRGVKKLISMTKLGRDVSPIFERLKWTFVEKTYTKTLEA